MKKTNITLTLWANRLAALLVCILLFSLPAILRWYCTVRFLSGLEQTALTVAFYCCAAVIFVALWNLDRLLLNIRNSVVFVTENVTRIRRVQWCCGGVTLICIPAAFCYYPLIFLVAIMGFLCLVTSVVCRVMDAAVAIREENDLTV